MRYKDAVLEELNEFNVVQPGRFNYQATLGSSHVPTAVFVHCLDAAGCDTIRLKAYGQEMPMLDEFMQTEPADVDHRWAEHNEWDMGTSFDSPYIWLFASATGVRHGITPSSSPAPGTTAPSTSRSSTKLAISRSRSTRGSSTSSSRSTAVCKVAYPRRSGGCRARPLPG